mgnify:CR=1 FL=1
MRNWNKPSGKLVAPSGSRFYSTYEELKLELDRGNYGYKRQFLQYLWGIETRLNIL